MKNFTLLIITVLVLNSSFLIRNCHSQWVYQHQFVLGQFLMDVEFINKNTGWVCGSGTILKTTNAGLNWEYQSHPATNKSLYSIHPVDSNVVYAVGYFETILKTTNGGTNWLAIRNGTYGQGKSYKGLYFINQNTGWICGAGQYVLRTTDGGVSFDSTYVWWGYLNDMYFKNVNAGIMVGNGGGIFKTSNAGINWIQSNIPPNYSGNFNKISVVQNQYCFAVETGKKVIRSSNFGDTWDSRGFISESDFPYCCTFSSINTGWVGGSYGQVFKTTNSGLNWRLENTGGDQRPLNSLYFFNDSIGWGVGSSGKIIFTTTGGLTFANNYIQKIPDKYLLYQNYPNPFNASTIIEYELKQRSEIELSVYDILGKRIQILETGDKPPGNYKVVLESGGLPSGIYFYELIINRNYKIIKKMIMRK